MRRILCARRARPPPLRLILGMAHAYNLESAPAALRDAPPRRRSCAAHVPISELAIFALQSRAAGRAPPAKSFGYDIYGVHAERPQAVMSFGARHAVAEAYPINPLNRCLHTCSAAAGASPAAALFFPASAHVGRAATTVAASHGASRVFRAGFGDFVTAGPPPSVHARGAPRAMA